MLGGGPLEHQPEGGFGILRSVGFSGACHFSTYLLEVTPRCAELGAMKNRFARGGLLQDIRKRAVGSRIGLHLGKPRLE